MPATAVRSSVSLAMPSSISRDLRTPSPRTSAADRSAILDSSSSPTSPLLLPLSDGAISKICGSLVEPEEKRQRWACHGCGSVFARDATIYMAPSAASTSSSYAAPAPLGDSSASLLNRRLAAAAKIGSSSTQEHFCRSCYTERFALGNCFACDKPVLGSTKEDGKFVKSALDGHIWHGRCWKCTGCGAAGAGKDVSLGMQGLPVCAACFDQPRQLRKHVVPPVPSSPFKEGSATRRVSPSVSASAASLSGSATRQGMGAAIAELSRKFGHPSVPPPTSSELPKQSPVIPQGSGRSESPTWQGLRRSNSVTRVKPLTAQFSGQGFNLAAFQPSTPTLSRSDSRSRCASPTKDAQLHDEVCAKCFKGPFEGPSASEQDSREARMISLHGGTLFYHSECFCCDVCSRSMENATLSFVRLAEGRFAHPSCAPPATVTRHKRTSSPSKPALTASSSQQGLEHATHQRVPCASTTLEVAHHTLPTSYLTGSNTGGTSVSSASSSVGDSSTHSSNGRSTSSLPSASTGTRRFQPSSGAAPPTRSTLLHQRPQSSNSQAMQANANMAVSSLARARHMSDGPSARFNRLGGMHVCGGCDKTVSSLEGTPGPRGQTWHRKCLVCNAPPPSTSSGTTYVSSRRLAPPPKMCGKQLDSSAKVNAEGQLRCRSCYDQENARHRVGA